ncbi:unnamed protein product [Phaedon cochleariae]|uniref:Peroxidase n=1 Tax=Phaedon cochleariae TaxID=80249 RepID=A0A9N9SQB6_PHACE|nr:unnamed protein product [Phaedon cochleariae]
MLLLSIWFSIFLISGVIGDDSCVAGPTSCEDTPYRSLDGSCNNLDNPSWGLPYTRYGRILPAKYGDGISTLPVAKSGKPLPGAREISTSLFPEVNITDRFLTLNTMQFGQFISHDLSLTVLGGSQSICCSPEGQMLNASSMPQGCAPISVSDDDPDYSQAKIHCLALLRTTTDLDRGCKISGTKPAEQLTQVTSYLDLSLIYGNDEKVNSQIRKFQGGLLSTEMRDGQFWPTNSKNKQKDCPFAVKNDVCYYATDDRFNQNPQLLALEVLFYREHNRIASRLSEVNPHWNDERLFQEARKINIGSYQNIMYYEWLPELFGRKVLISEQIIHDTHGYIDDYQDTVNPAVLNEFSNAAYRHFHTAVAGSLDLMKEDRSTENSLRLSDWYHRSESLEVNENLFDDLVRGLNTQHQMEFDRYHDKEISLYLFRGKQSIGRDILAIDIQRSRDHGLASYNDMRQFCGYKKAITFRDFSHTMSHQHIRMLEDLYEQPDDVDLYVGGSLESRLPHSLVGPTFRCILLEEFYLARTTDRYWFERSSEFTKPQLAEIRKASMSRIVCDNSKDIRSMQENAFVAPGSKKTLIPCSELPAIDLEMWKEN